MVNLPSHSPGNRRWISSVKTERVNPSQVPPTTGTCDSTSVTVEETKLFESFCGLPGYGSFRCTTRPRSSGFGFGDRVYGTFLYELLLKESSCSSKGEGPPKMGGAVRRTLGVSRSRVGTSGNPLVSPSTWPDVVGPWFGPVTFRKLFAYLIGRGLNRGRLCHSGCPNPIDTLNSQDSVMGRFGVKG